MGKNEGPSQQRKPHFWGLLQHTQPKGACQQSVLTSTTGRIMLTCMLRKVNHLDICWKSNIASCKQSWTTLECFEDNLIHDIEKPTTREMLLDLSYTNMKEIIRHVKTGGILGCSDQALVEFTTLRDMGQIKSRVRTLNFRRADFHLLKELVYGMLWKTALRDKGMEQSLQLFNNNFLGV